MSEDAIRKRQPDRAAGEPASRAPRKAARSRPRRSQGRIASGARAGRIGPAPPVSKIADANSQLARSSEPMEAMPFSKGHPTHRTAPGLPEAVLFESRRDGVLVGLCVVARFGFGGEILR